MNYITQDEDEIGDRRLASEKTDLAGPDTEKEPGLIARAQQLLQGLKT